ncbi:MAG: hypothetical protein MI974_02620 [Chitinophagales bacterium]|nr:hypothetical protein [Chitinophagales bacterium]
MKRLLIACFLCISMASFAQSGLAGIWEGTITYGGIESQTGYKFELFLELEGKYIKGRSYIYIRPDSIIHQDLSGRMYEDRSIYLKEVNVDYSDPESFDSRDEVPEDLFVRKYQFIYNRSIWDSSIEGYWQEMIPTPFDYRRDRGRIKLKKKSSKA